jgi:hypothetical protein
MKARIVVSLIALFALTFPGLAAEFEWGDTAVLKAHLEDHVKYPATGKAIKESCKKAMPDEFTKEQGAYFDSTIKDDATYKSPQEVLSAMNLK